MREFRDKDFKDDFPYGRPTVSAWIAAIAVAFAVFILGGFIKTYRQLEALREESRREIRELRTVVDGLRTHTPPGAGQASSRISPLPQASRTVNSRPSRNAAGFPPDAMAQTPVPPSRSFLPEIDAERPRLTYSIGRTSGDGDVKKPQCQVVAVNNLQKRLMVEGGRNLGLDEGARLELSRQGRWIGDLRVLDVFDTLSSCEVLHATLPPEPGDVVRMPR